MGECGGPVTDGDQGMGGCGGMGECGGQVAGGYQGMGGCGGVLVNSSMLTARRVEGLRIF